MIIDSLLVLLDQLSTIHEELLQLAKEKMPVLVNNDVPKLNAIVHKENKLVKQVSELERQRIQLTGEYLISRGYNADPRVTIGHLVRIIFKVEEKKALMEAQRRLLGLLAELKKLNEVNQKLIKQSLEFINFSVDLLVDEPGQNMFYKSPTSPAGKPMRAGLFDTRA